jgi:hypothetical protein
LLSGGGGAGGSSGAIIMTGPKVLYVNGTTGSDTLYDGSQATVDATNTHGPFKTLQKAQNATTLYNLNGYNITINVAAGTYGPVQCGAINGSGIIYYVGNPSNPASVVVQNNIGPCFQFTAKGYSVDGFTVTSTGHSPGVTGAGIYVLGGGGVAINTINFGYCIDQHIALDGAGIAGYFGPITISGGTVSHILSLNSSFIRCGLYATPVNITAAMTISTYIYVLGNAGVQVFCTFTGYANVTAGSKFAASANGVINTGGAGVNHFPGPTAGTLATGGQYV